MKTVKKKWPSKHRMVSGSWFCFYVGRKYTRSLNYLESLGGSKRYFGLSFTLITEGFGKLKLLDGNFNLWWKMKENQMQKTEHKVKTALKAQSGLQPAWPGNASRAQRTACGSPGAPSLDWMWASSSALDTWVSKGSPAALYQQWVCWCPHHGGGRHPHDFNTPAVWKACQWSDLQWGHTPP